MPHRLQIAIQALCEAIRALPGEDESRQQMADRGLDRGRYDDTSPIREELKKVLDFLEAFVGDAEAEVFAKIPRPLVDSLIGKIDNIKGIVDSIPVKCRRQPPPPSVVLPTFEGAEARVALRVENLYSEIYSQLASLQPRRTQESATEKDVSATTQPAPVVKDASPRVQGVVSGIPDSPRPVVITLHGIRTNAKWQNDLDECLSGAHFISKSLSYGWLGVLPFLLKGHREKKVKWFLNEYQTICQKYPGSRLSVIAHSFGTYIIARAISMYGGLIKFDKVILCGSIVPVDFPWSTLIKAGVVNQVLNDYGHLDFWAGKVGLVLPDAGPSGQQGFTDLAGGNVDQRRHPEWGHSHYFFELNYKKRWINFLEGKTFEDLSLEPHWHFPMVWKGVIFIIILFLLAVSLRACRIL